MALIDSGSLHTIVPASALEGIEIGEPVTKLDVLRFCAWEDTEVPVHRLDMSIAAPSPWKDIELPQVAVAVVPGELPFVVLGSTALTHVAVLIRDHDQLVHVKPIGDFHSAAHNRDPRF